MLRTPQSKDDAFSLLPSLELQVAAHATEAVPQGTGNAASASGKHDLISKTITASDYLEVVSAEEHKYIVWKTVLHLSRPRVRLQRPAAYFKAHLTVTAEALRRSRHQSKDYLRSFETLPVNVLEPLQHDPAVGKSGIYLSETRITKSTPLTAGSQNDVKPLRTASKRAYPIVPALFTKIRYSASPDAIIASLHIETSQVISNAVEIKDIGLKVAGAQIEALNPIQPPFTTQAGSESVLLYRLTPTQEARTSSPSTMSVSIEALVTSEHDSHHELEIQWQSQVDLSQTASQPIYKWSRPLSGHQTQPSLQITSRPSSADMSRKASSPAGGIAFTFHAARTAVVHQEFKLHVHCVNHSSRARRLALAVVPRAKRPPPPQLSQPQTEPDDTTGPVARLFNTTTPPAAERQKPPDVLDLNPDVRIGPLPTGACYETDLNFRAMKTGVLDLGIVRIVDLDTRQTVDVRELPDVIAVESREGHG